MGKDFGCREDVEDVEHRLGGTHVPRGISCAIPVNANMTCRVCRKQQRFPVLVLLRQSKIALHLAVLLYLPPLLTLDENTNIKPHFQHNKLTTSM